MNNNQRQNGRRPFLAHISIESIQGSTWINLFDGHDSLSDVWHAAPHPDPLLWMLWMSNYQNDSGLRLFAIWSAKSVVSFVPGAERPARGLFTAARTYAAGLSSREQFDTSYEIYCRQMARATPLPDNQEESEKGINSARSAIHAIVIDDALGAALDASCMAETTFRIDFSGFGEELAGADLSLDSRLKLSEENCNLASETFGARAADALRMILGDPFLLVNEEKGKRHLELLRQAIRLRPLLKVG